VNCEGLAAARFTMALPRMGFAVYGFALYDFYRAWVRQV
jgi:hypothetical protein